MSGARGSGEATGYVDTKTTNLQTSPALPFGTSDEERGDSLVATGQQVKVQGVRVIVEEYDEVQLAVRGANEWTRERDAWEEAGLGERGCFPLMEGSHTLKGDLPREMPLADLTRARTACQRDRCKHARDPW